MGDWGALRISGGVATFDTDLAVAYLEFLEKSKNGSITWNFLIFPLFPSISKVKSKKKTKVPPRCYVKFSDFPFRAFWAYRFFLDKKINSNWAIALCLLSRGALYKKSLGNPNLEYYCKCLFSLKLENSSIFDLFLFLCSFHKNKFFIFGTSCLFIQYVKNVPTLLENVQRLELHF